MSNAVVATDVVLGYGAHVALDRSSFEIPRPGITAIIGPNGSGKSTILNAIAGLLSPLSGSIDVAGRRPGERRISYVLQTTKVNDHLPVTVEEVVTMGRYASAGWFSRLKTGDRERVQSAMDRTGATDLRRRHLDELSGGQRQRAFLAQGLAQDHDILLLDEPLSGIDHPTARAIDQVIHNRRRHHTRPDRSAGRRSRDPGQRTRPRVGAARRGDHVREPGQGLRRGRHSPGPRASRHRRSSPWDSRLTSTAVKRPHTPETPC